MSNKGKGGGGKKGKEKKDPNKFSNVDKQFCELTITDLNTKLARLRTHLATLDENNVTLADKVRELEYDHTDVAAHLDRQLKEKEDVIVELVERLTEITKVREHENTEQRQRIFDLETKYKLMYEQLTSEIKLLNGKLHSLDEFRIQRDTLLARFYDQDQQLLEKDRENKINLLELEQKAMLEKDTLKKEVDERLFELADDFMKAYEQRSSSYMNRLIRENFALRKELDLVVDTLIRHNTDYEEHQFKKKQMILDIKNLEDINLSLLKKLSQKTNLISRLQLQTQTLKEKVLEVSKFRAQYELKSKNESCQRFVYTEAMDKLKRLGKKLEIMTLEKNDLQAVHCEQEAEISFLRDVLGKVKKCTEDAIMCRRRLEAESDDFNAHDYEKKKEDLMNMLMALMASTRLPDFVKTVSMADLSHMYHPGHLGFVPLEPQSSLFDHFMYQDDKTESDVVLQKAVPLPPLKPSCRTDNQIFDCEIGSNYFVSSSTHEDIIEEEIRVDDGDGDDDDQADSGTDEDKEEIICTKDEKPAAPAGKVSAKEISFKPEDVKSDSAVPPASEPSQTGEAGLEEDIAEYFFY